MFKKYLDKLYNEFEHEHRFMISLVCAELIFLALIHFWPKLESDINDVEYTFESEEIYVEEVIVTRQSTAPASPPKPQAPVPVPNDEIIEEEVEFPDLDDLLTDNPIQIETDMGKVGDAGEVVGSPDRPPGIVRIVEPAIPEAAKRAGVKAEVFVSFLVGRQGDVEEVYISEIRLYNGNDYEVVEDIGYGILGAIMDAASKWRFRGARDGGEAVKTYVQNNFRIGF